MIDLQEVEDVSVKTARRQAAMADVQWMKQVSLHAASWLQLLVNVVGTIESETCLYNVKTGL